MLFRPEAQGVGRPHFPGVELTVGDRPVQSE